MCAKVQAFVPHSAVKDILTQLEVTGKRCKLITRIQEFNLEINITKLIRGQGLAKLMTEESLDLVKSNQTGENNQAITSIVRQPYYTDIVFFLKNAKCPDYLSDNQKRSLKLQTQRYVLIQGYLFWKDKNGVLLLCLDKYQAKKVLIEMHEGECGGHFSAKTTAHKILRAGYYWPTLFKDTYTHVSKCEPC